MILTSVRPHRGQQVVLTWDDGEETVLDKRTFEESPYGVGSFLSCDELEELCALSRRNRAREKAVFLLSRRDYSRRELEQKLCREKGRYHPENQEAAAEAAAYMEQLGYVKDAQYAHRLACEYRDVRCYPRRRALEKLCEKGITREVAREVLDEMEWDDTQLALEFLIKKRYNIPRSREETEKQLAALARYGFAGEDIRRAMRRREEEEQ
ncbi:MAG: regulatory protein RecX [Clostridia bacterium]|nr:regulatory protein RecX [Clostridia bacterium]